MTDNDYDDLDTQDREIQDLAADMRERGRSWADIAHDLALPEATVKRAVVHPTSVPLNSPLATRSPCSDRWNRGNLGDC